MGGTGVWRAVVVLVAAAVAAPVPVWAASGTAQGTGCVARVAGDRTLRVLDGGHAYRVAVHLPAGYTGRRQLPVLLNLHGNGLTGQQQQGISKVRPLADQRHVIALAPDGAVPVGRGRGWNVPGVPLDNGRMAPRGTRDDVRFLDSVIHAAEAAYCVDQRRVYLFGFSVGARMASAFACRRADEVAGFGAVGGLRAGPPDAGLPRLLNSASCRPSRPVPVISFHGTADQTNPYLGGGAAYWGYPVPVAVLAWRQRNSCLPMPVVLPAAPRVLRSTGMACAGGADVEAYTVVGGTHTWPATPDGRPAPLAAQPDHELDATATIWSFLSLHRR